MNSTFKDELKRLKLTRNDVCNLLGCTYPTLQSRINKPDSFTLQELKSLQGAGFDIYKFIEIN